jgi:ribosomal protein S18 acetylase RimI-like enzyme
MACRYAEISFSRWQAALPAFDMVNYTHLDAAVQADHCAGEVDIFNGRLCELVALVDAVIDAAAQGFFSRHFLSPRWQFGFAIQLVFAILFRRLKMHGQWRLTKACVQVARSDEGVVGFSLIREVDGSQKMAAQEIVLICVVRAARRRGVGEALIRSALNRVSCDQAVLVECLLQNRAINGLMKKLGARHIKQSSATSACVYATRTYAIDGTATNFSSN